MRPIEIRDIQEAACKQFNVTRGQLVGPSRMRFVARPRQIAMYVARSIYGKRLVLVGKLFGGRDHTTVLHAERRIKNLLAEGDKGLAEDIANVLSMLDDMRAAAMCAG